MRTKSKWTTVLVALLSLIPWQVKAVVSAGEYYIVNDFFEKLLTNSSGNPRLITYDSRTDKHIYCYDWCKGSLG